MIRISPPGREADTSGSDDTPLLSLTHFSRPPFVTFGCVEPGVSRSADLVLQNPSPEPAYLTVYKLPTHRGFTVPDTDILIPVSTREGGTDLSHIRNIHCLVAMAFE